MIAGGVYIGWMLSYWIGLRILDNGRVWVYLAMFIIFASDTGAFFVGRKWGKNKLAVTISPKKTWEGALGGVVSAVLGASIVFIVLGYIEPLPLNYQQLIPFALLISIFAQFGDLVESVLKRNAGVKESGSFLPGHGGILDRFDSHIFVGVLVYHYVLAFSSQWPSWLW
jgi:phosphatidate cytidylyltransferase